MAPLRIVHFFAPLRCPKCVLCAWWNCNSTTQRKRSKKCSLHREVTRAQRRSCLWEDVQCVHSTPSHCQTSGSPCRAALPRRCNEHDVPLVLKYSCNLLPQRDDPTHHISPYALQIFTVCLTIDCLQPAADVLHCDSSKWSGLLQLSARGY